MKVNVVSPTTPNAVLTATAPAPSVTTVKAPAATNLPTSAQHPPFPSTSTPGVLGVHWSGGFQLSCLAQASEACAFSAPGDVTSDYSYYKEILIGKALSSSDCAKQVRCYSAEEKRRHGLDANLAAEGATYDTRTGDCFAEFGVNYIRDNYVGEAFVGCMFNAPEEPEITPFNSDGCAMQMRCQGCTFDSDHYYMISSSMTVEECAAACVAQAGCAGLTTFAAAGQQQQRVGWCYGFNLVSPSKASTKENAEMDTWFKNCTAGTAAKPTGRSTAITRITDTTTTTITTATAVEAVATRRKTDCEFTFSECTELCETAEGRDVTVTRIPTEGGKACPMLSDVPDCTPGDGFCPVLQHSTSTTTTTTTTTTPTLTTTTNTATPTATLTTTTNTATPTATLTTTTNTATHTPTTTTTATPTAKTAAQYAGCASYGTYNLLPYGTFNLYFDNFSGCKAALPDLNAGLPEGTPKWVGCQGPFAIDEYLPYFASTNNCEAALPDLNAVLPAGTPKWVGCGNRENKKEAHFRSVPYFNTSHTCKAALPALNAALAPTTTITTPTTSGNDNAYGPTGDDDITSTTITPATIATPTTTATVSRSVLSTATPGGRTTTTPTTTASLSGSSTATHSGRGSTTTTAGGLSRACQDLKVDGVAWHDSENVPFHCQWYAMGNNCARYGSGRAWQGYTANQACCSCGGGVEGHFAITALSFRGFKHPSDLQDTSTIQTQLAAVAANILDPSVVVVGLRLATTNCAAPDGANVSTEAAAPTTGTCKLTAYLLLHARGPNSALETSVVEAVVAGAIRDKVLGFTICQPVHCTTHYAYAANTTAIDPNNLDYSVIQRLRPEWLRATTAATRATSTSLAALAANVPGTTSTNAVLFATCAVLACCLLVGLVIGATVRANDRKRQRISKPIQLDTLRDMGGGHAAVNAMGSFAKATTVNAAFAGPDPVPNSSHFISSDDTNGSPHYTNIDESAAAKLERPKTRERDEDGTAGGAISANLVSADLSEGKISDEDITSLEQSLMYTDADNLLHSPSLNLSCNLNGHVTHHVQFSNKTSPSAHSPTSAQATGSSMAPAFDVGLPAQLAKWLDDCTKDRPTLDAAMFSAAKVFNRTVLQLLTQKGGRLTAINELKQTLLHVCIIHYEEPNAKPCLNMAQFLLRHQLDVNAQDMQGGTALMYACRKGSAAMVQLLLGCGASASVQDSTLMTAYMFAVVADSGAVLQVLLETCAATYEATQDDVGRSALHWAVLVKSHDCFRLLIEDPITDVCVRDDKGETVLHYLARSTKTSDILKILLFDIRPNVLIHLSQLISAMDQTVAMLADDEGNRAFLAQYIAALKRAIDDHDGTRPTRPAAVNKKLKHPNPVVATSADAKATSRTTGLAALGMAVPKTDHSQARRRSATNDPPASSSSDSGLDDSANSGDGTPSTSLLASRCKAMKNRPAPRQAYHRSYRSRTKQKQTVLQKTVTELSEQNTQLVRILARVKQEAEELRGVMDVQEYLESSCGSNEEHDVAMPKCMLPGTTEGSTTI